MAARDASPMSRHRVVVLPDFFIDAIAPLPKWSKAVKPMADIVANGGGNLPVGPIEFKVGGNAANVGLALARLGAQVQLLTHTNPLGHQMLTAAREAGGLGIDHVRVGPTTSATLALEFKGANLMLSHAGPLLDFGPDDLSAAAWKTLEAADAVVFNNWSQNHAGTRLLGAVAARLARRDSFLYLDTGDPRHRDPRHVSQLAGDARIWNRVDAWGLNENEVRAFSGDPPGALPKLAASLSERLGTRLDVHTRQWAATVHQGATTRVPAFRTKPRRLTGSGDAWNAGNVAGYLLGVPDRQRLKLAHTVADLYVTGESGLPPRANDVPAALFRKPRS